MRALQTITEGGTPIGNPLAQFPAKDYIHANAGELGTIRGVDDGLGGVPTVFFDRTGTGTIVRDDEVEVIAS